MTKARTLADNFAADINGITAGTGITGGGTSGTVTVTNSMATAIDAKGDLVVGTGADTFSRLAVGANDTVLVAASGEATGLKWAAPAGPTIVGVQLNTSGGFAISNNTFTLVDWDTEVFDTDAFHSTGSNPSRVTIPSGKGGKYQVTVRIPWAYNNAGYRRVVIKKDGSTNVRFEVQAAPQVNTTSVATVTLATVMEVTAGDYYEIELYQNSGGTLNTNGGIAWGEVTWIYLGA